MLLKNIKWTDFDANKRYDFVVVLGSTEQHGPFLPFGSLL
jgi:creatinine amidohydrolase/Fe(II)-dependent formamide hydrolase-like protein